HYGIAFIARIRNPDIDRRMRVSTTEAHLLDVREQLPGFGLQHNKQVAELAATRVRAISMDSVLEAEIAENLKYQRRYRLHDRFAKPLMRRTGRLFFEFSLEDLDQEIQMLIESRNTGGCFLDVACGDNSLVFDL